MQKRLYAFYGEIEAVEEKTKEIQTRIASIKEEKISGENVYLFLHYYGTMYKEFTDAEKRSSSIPLSKALRYSKKNRPTADCSNVSTSNSPSFMTGMRM